METTNKEEEATFGFKTVNSYLIPVSLPQSIGFEPDSVYAIPTSTNKGTFNGSLTVNDFANDGYLTVNDFANDGYSLPFSPSSFASAVSNSTDSYTYLSSTEGTIASTKLSLAGIYNSAASIRSNSIEGK